MFLMPWDDVPGRRARVCVLNSLPVLAWNVNFHSGEDIIDLVRLIGGCLNSFFFFLNISLGYYLCHNSFGCVSGFLVDLQNRATGPTA